jgi:hypothetical protein
LNPVVPLHAGFFVARNDERNCHWKGFASTSFGALYDESDEITKPAAERSEAWKKRADDLLYCGIGGWMPSGGHFYMIEIGC